MIAYYLSTAFLIFTCALLIFMIYKIRSSIKGPYSFVSKIFSFTSFLLIQLILVSGVIHNLPELEGNLRTVYFKIHSESINYFRWQRCSISCWSVLIWAKFFVIWHDKQLCHVSTVIVGNLGFGSPQHLPHLGVGQQGAVWHHCQQAHLHTESLLDFLLSGGCCGLLPQTGRISSCLSYWKQLLLFLVGVLQHLPVLATDNKPNHCPGQVHMRKVSNCIPH